MSDLFISDLLKAVSTGFTAFTATNLDDILILLLFFSQISATFRRRHIVAGQYLGFTALVLASLPGFFGSMLLPRPWIGMLGIVPIAIGVSRLLTPDTDDEEDAEVPLILSHPGSPASFLPKPLVVQKSPKSLMHRESHNETGVTEKGMTWDAQVSTQKAISHVYPPTLSSTANSIESMDCPQRPTPPPRVL